MEEPSNVELLLIKKKLMKYLEEDVGYGDISSHLIPNKRVKAKIISKSDGIVCGIREAKILLDLCNIDMKKILNDGNKIKKGKEIILLEGNLHDILGIERLVLNLMMKMSSIASSTNIMTNYDDSLNENIKPNYKIAASRKTTPGFRYFEKRAVEVGGGDTHRWRLDDMVMLKDTHLDASNETIYELITRARKQTSFSKKIEVEVENEKMALEAIKAEPDILMLDNIAPNAIPEIIDKIKKFCKANNKKIPIIEASGNITYENFEKYAKTGVDILSTSEITLNPAIKIDISLKIIKD